MRREFRPFAVEGERGRGSIPYETGAVAPTREPLQEFAADQQPVSAIQTASAIDLPQPLDELPAFIRKKLLLVRGARGQLDDFTERSALFAGAGAIDDKLNEQAAQIGLVGQRAHFAPTRPRGGRRIQ